ncbi:group 1 truncated hemoglobin [Fulvimarina sp. MAC8]|uniref:group I truncated hemoglobin n=1 Tax=Fulvimarina sp. MAC8 TaxID=3162874 RepID=UPI0032EEFAC9
MSNTNENKSLFERLGGIYGISGAVDDLVNRLYTNESANKNPAVRHFHEQGGEAGFKFLVTAWSIQETGGPKIYPGRDMRESHAHLKVDQDEFDNVYTTIKQTLYQVGVPKQEREEFMAIIESYRSMVVAPENQAA